MISWPSLFLFRLVKTLVRVGQKECYSGFPEANSMLCVTSMSPIGKIGTGAMVGSHPNGWASLVLWALGQQGAQSRENCPTTLFLGDISLTCLQTEKVLKQRNEDTGKWHLASMARSMKGEETWVELQQDQLQWASKKSLGRESRFKGGKTLVLSSCFGDTHLSSRAYYDSHTVVLGKQLTVLEFGLLFWTKGKTAILWCNG